MDREIKFEDLSDVFDPIGMSCSEIMEDNNSHTDSFFIPKIDSHQADNRKNGAICVKESIKSQVSNKFKREANPISNKIASYTSIKECKRSECIPSQTPLPIFDCILCVNDFVVFQKYTNEHLFHKHANQFIDMKIFELSYLCNKSKENAGCIQPFNFNKKILLNICRTSTKVNHPTILKYVFDNAKNQHKKLVKQSKLKSKSPIKCIQLKLDAEENHFVSTNKNIEDLNMSEIKSEISLVKIRKFQNTRQNISFESEVHNIYDPQYSSIQSSKSIESSVIESFISTDTIVEERPNNQVTNKVKDRVVKDIPHMSHIPEVKFNMIPLRNTPVKMQNRAEIPQFLFRHNSNKSKDNLESSLELCLQNDDSQTNRNTFSKYLSIANKSKLKNEMKHTISSICFEVKDNLGLVDSKYNPEFVRKISIRNSEISQNKEIQGVSFSNEFKETYQLVNPSYHNNSSEKLQTAKQKLSSDKLGLFNNNSVLKCMNFGKQVKEHNSVLKKRMIDKSSNYKELNLFNSNKTDEASSIKDGRVSSFSQYVNNDDKTQTDNTCNIQLDFMNSYENDSSKFISKIQRQQSSIERSQNSLSNNRDNKSDQNIRDFMQRSMNSLKILKRFAVESSNISKLKDETLKSVDLPSSPDLGRTKDTSSLSVTKLKNKVNMKAQLSNNSNSSIPCGVRKSSKIITSSDIGFVKTFQTQSVTKGKEFNSNSKYLVDTIKFNDKEQQCFADRIEALKEYEESHSRYIKASLPYKTTKEGSINKIPTMFQLKKSQSSKDYSDYTTAVRKTPMTMKNSAKKQNRESLIKCDDSKLQKKQFSSICMSKEWKPTCSENASLVSDFSSK